MFVVVEGVAIFLGVRSLGLKEERYEAGELRLNDFVV